jgi:hypothetical protein
MAKVLQFRRDTTSGISTVTGAEGELFVDLSKDTLVVMDGTTAGGQPLQKEITASTNINAGIVTASTSVTSPFIMNYNTILENFTVPANYNASSVGPLTVSIGVVVTLGTNANWVIL